MARKAPLIEPRLAKTKPVVPSQAPLARRLDASFWLTFGPHPEPAKRDKIIFVTIDDIRRVGPSSFRTTPVCDVLGGSSSLINFYFGSKDELVAEATAQVIERFHADVWAKVEAAPRKPRERLRAWIVATEEAYQAIGGWGIIMNYPNADVEVTALVASRYGQKMVDVAELSLARLVQLVDDVDSAAVSDNELVLGQLPSDWHTARPLTLVRAMRVALSTNGLAVWRTGRHAVAARREGEQLDQAVTASHIQHILDHV